MRSGGKKEKRQKFTGISLEQKWKDKHENEAYSGNKSGNKFLVSIINYNGQNK